MSEIRIIRTKHLEYCSADGLVSERYHPTCVLGFVFTHPDPGTPQEIKDEWREIADCVFNRMLNKLKKHIYDAKRRRKRDT